MWEVQRHSCRVLLPTEATPGFQRRLTAAKTAGLGLWAGIKRRCGKCGSLWKYHLNLNVATPPLPHSFSFNSVQVRRQSEGKSGGKVIPLTSSSLILRVMSGRKVFNIHHDAKGSPGTKSYKLFVSSFGFSHVLSEVSEYLQQLFLNSYQAFFF